MNMSIIIVSPNILAAKIRFENKIISLNWFVRVDPIWVLVF